MTQKQQLLRTERASRDPCAGGLTSEPAPGIYTPGEPGPEPQRGLSLRARTAGHQAGHSAATSVLHETQGHVWGEEVVRTGR